MEYENWRPITGEPTGYEVSDLGRVRRRLKDGYRIIRAAQNSKGYLKVCLGRKRQEYVHRLVAFAFLGPAPEIPEDAEWDYEVDHYNFDIHDNRLQNLRWLPGPENWARKKAFERGGLDAV